MSEDGTSINSTTSAVPHLVGTYQTAAQKPSLEAVLAAAKSQSWSSIPEGVRIDAWSLKAGRLLMFSAASPTASDRGPVFLQFPSSLPPIRFFAD